jgi:hypothetical protein
MDGQQAAPKAEVFPRITTNGHTGKNEVNRLVLAGWPADLAAYATEGYEPWAAHHNAEIWHWRNQADGFYE